MSDTEEISEVLTPKQYRFCQEYIIDLNQTQAYIRAGYAETGAGQNASLLMNNHKIKATISKLQKDRAKRLELDADKVLAQISRLAFSDIRGIFDGADGLRRVAELDDDTAAAVQSIKVTKKPSGEQDEHGNQQYEDVVEYKLADKKAPLEMLAKHFELLVDKSKVESEVTGTVAVICPSKAPMPDDNGNRAES